MNKKLEGLGEIVTWVSPKSVQLSFLRQSLTDADIDPELARDMYPGNAFRRALHKLEEHRVIRQTKNADGELHFQFTSEYMMGGEFHYRKECDIILDKRTGNVSCDEAEIERHAQQLVDDQLSHRNGSDVTTIIKRLFDRNGDLFPLREHGGVYFVPQCHSELSDKVEKFLSQIGGELNRWEMESSPRNTANAACAVRDELQRMIEDYKKYSLALKSDDPNVMAKGMGKINEIRLKMGAYSGLLTGYTSQLGQALDGITRDLQVLAGMAVTEPVAAVPETVEEPVAEEVKEPTTAAEIFKSLLG